MIFGARLRFRSTKGLSTDAQSISFEIGGLKAELIAAPEPKTLKDAPWMIIKVLGFSDRNQALQFGQRLRIALQLTSIRRSWGVDVGEDKATSALFKGITDQLAEQGHIVRSNIHGLDIFEDLPGTKWFWMEAKAKITAQPDPIIAEIQRLFASSPIDEPKGFDAVRLLNESLVSREAAAQLILAIAAVEHLARGDNWTQSQRETLQSLANAVDTDSNLAPEERLELSEMLRKSVHRMSVRQSQRRLLRELDLENLWRPWDRLYARRSEILHGLTYSSNTDRSAIVQPALAMASRIVLTAVDLQAKGAADDLETILPLSPSW